MDIIIAILAIMGLALAIYWGGVGAKSAASRLFSGDKLPEGVERLKIRKQFYRHGLVRVKYIWYFTEFNTYSACVECPYINGEERIEASSIAALERKIELVVHEFGRRIDAKNGRT